MTSPGKMNVIHNTKLQFARDHFGNIFRSIRSQIDNLTWTILHYCMSNKLLGNRNRKVTVHMNMLWLHLHGDMKTCPYQDSKREQHGNGNKQHPHTPTPLCPFQFFSTVFSHKHKCDSRSMGKSTVEPSQSHPQVSFGWEGGRGLWALVSQGCHFHITRVPDGAPLSSWQE